MDNTRYLLSITDRLEDNETSPLGGVSADVVTEQPEVEAPGEDTPSALDIFGFPEWKFSGGLDINIPIHQAIPKSAIDGMARKRDRSDSTPSRQSNWSGYYWYEQFDFHTPAHHQIAEKVIEEDLHKLAVNLLLMESPIPKVPWWVFRLAPEEDPLSAQ